jgi:NADH-quinone oxidoreductase subunit M
MTWPLDILLAVALLTVLLMAAMGGQRYAGALATLLYGVQLALLAWIGWLLRDTPTDGIATALSFTVMDTLLSWRMTGLGWFFALVTVGIALFTAAYAAGAWGRERAGMRLYQVAMALNVLAMLLLLSSGDLLSLFIGWELVSWAGFLIMAQRGGEAVQAAFRYLIYAMAGAMAMLAAIILLKVQAGGLGFAMAGEYLTSAPRPMIWLLMLLFASAFLIKLAMVPFHLWQPRAYSLTPGPAAAFLGAISSRMGLFAFAAVLINLLGVDAMSALEIPYTFLSARDLWLWIAAITIIVPTFIALTQSDARLLLAWHGIGQSGYMLMGLLVATPLGVSGGLLHVFNYATYQAALFLAVTAVAYRTGTTNLDRLGGLVTRMPLTFVTLLLGIIGLAGLPPMNGFVSKWLIYKSLLIEEMPLLFLAASIGTLGTILSVYKLIHNIFLGQLRQEHETVAEVPWSMVIPMLGLGAIAFVTGYMPGLALGLVAIAQDALGVAPLDFHLGGVTTVAGSLNMLWVVSLMLVAIGFAALLFYTGNRSSRVHQFDNYAGGHFLSADMRYHYSHNFYAGLMRVIGPWYRGSIEWLESGLVSITAFSTAVSQAVYRSRYVGYYLPLTALALLWWSSGL